MDRSELDKNLNEEEVIAAIQARRETLKAQSHQKDALTRAVEAVVDSRLARHIEPLKSQIELLSEEVEQLRKALGRK